MPWQRVLVLGGIRSGKSEFAESLVTPYPPVRYVATARRDEGDAEWTARIDAHRARRLSQWRTSEVGDTPYALPDLLTAAGCEEADSAADRALIVDDLGGWVGTVMEAAAADRWPSLIDGLSTAVSRCSPRLVLVSPEVGLSVVPNTPAGRAFADALGAVNQAVAAVCDIVVLVIAGNAVPVKGRL
jgi:adenosyl cobinamide kinase/adenosyl cobinamide phosphate guanylyltransferase